MNNFLIAEGVPFPRQVNPEVSRLIDPPEEKDDRDRPSFHDMLSGALGKVNSLQHEAAEGSKNLVTGDIESLHELMIKSEEARLSLQITVQVTNKVIEAYQELSRLQV